MYQLIIYCLATALLIESVAYIASLITKNSSIADVVWGLGFIGIAKALIIKSDSSSWVLYLMAVLVSLWGIRLAYHIGRRNIGKAEDFRYQAWRKKWGRWFSLRSYLQNFLLQGVLMVFISASLIVAANSDVISSSLSWWQVAGILVWIYGFMFEIVADYQLAKFIKNNKKDGAIMQSGLWAYSRHPNYFGEIMQWWGLWLIVITLPYGLLAVISPLTITLLILSSFSINLRARLTTCWAIR